MLHTAKVSNKTTFVSLVQKFVEKIILQILPLKSIYLTVQVVPGLHWSRFTSSELTSLFKYIHKKNVPGYSICSKVVLFQSYSVL